MVDFKTALEVRLEALESILKPGVIPGEIDTYDLYETKGAIRELKIVLRLLGDSWVIHPPKP